MARNNFLNSVVRGFGSQIGRDSAKVLTNSMYGNAHATPYKNASSEVEVDLNSHYEKLTQEELNELNSTRLDDWCRKYNCTYSVKGSNEISGLYYIGWLFLCLMGPLGMIIALYKGYMHYNLKKEMDNKRYIIEHPYIEEYTTIDNRTKTGYRTNKRKNVESIECSFRSSKNEWYEKEKDLGIMYFVVSFIAVLIFIWMLYV